MYKEMVNELLTLTSRDILDGVASYLSTHEPSRSTNKVLLEIEQYANSIFARGQSLYGNIFSYLTGKENEQAIWDGIAKTIVRPLEDIVWEAKGDVTDLWESVIVHANSNIEKNTDTVLSNWLSRPTSNESEQVKYKLYQAYMNKIQTVIDSAKTMAQGYSGLLSQYANTMLTTIEDRMHGLWDKYSDNKVLSLLIDEYIRTRDTQERRHIVNTITAIMKDTCDVVAIADSYLYKARLSPQYQRDAQWRDFTEQVLLPMCGKIEHAKQYDTREFFEQVLQQYIEMER